MSAVPQIGTEPDFRHVDAWIFDLDNTLYPSASGIFAQIDARMTAFMSELLSVSREQAQAIQKAYYREHGTTLNGLMTLHGVDPDDYLAFVHDIDLAPLVREPLLDSRLSQLRGRRFIFTNGCRHHARRVLERLELGGHFDDVWDIRTLGFRPKPNPIAYDTVQALAGFRPERAAMFDDAARNLVPAHKLGMTTVWISNASPWSAQGPDQPIAGREHIDHETACLADFLSTIRI